MKNALTILQFLPLSIFLLVARAQGFTDAAWAMAFQISGLAAILETLIFSYLRFPQNRLLIGTNLYLAVGGLGFAFRVSNILDLYGNMRESALFGSVFLVGLITTTLAPTG